jgi:2,4-dienoyl-CoA reductase-like NADH-dependent reductase (Old Yellow Enzyme family)
VEFPGLFSPLRLGPHTARNRIVFGAHKGLQQNGDKLSVQAFFVAMYISQVAEDISAQQGAFSYDGAVYGDSRKDQGQGTLVKCSGTFPEVRAAWPPVSSSTSRRG